MHNTINRQISLYSVLRNEMLLRGYSHKTIKSYTSALRGLTRFFPHKHPRDLTETDVRAYLLHLIQDKEYAPSTINQIFNAIRFLYVEVYKRSFIIETIPRPKRGKKLPVILSRHEVKRVLDCIVNPKHKAVITVIYSAGLRLAESINLRPGDIDSHRMVIHIRSGKGKRDRYTILSETALAVLREYWRMYTPKNWLFEGRTPGKKYSPRSVEKFFSDAIDRAGIQKQATVHTLRHSFATHLLEEGVDIKYIKELLGHQLIQTTEIYTHVTERQISKIRSPLDGIM